MGGADINLGQADIQGEVVLDVTAVFGGVKIVLPSNWKVVSEMSAVFGGIEDKRQVVEDNARMDKLLILRGTSVFGGIEIKNF
jgi:predicted membrane protein